MVIESRCTDILPIKSFTKDFYFVSVIYILRKSFMMSTGLAEELMRLDSADSDYSRKITFLSLVASLAANVTLKVFTPSS